ncbi:hypothetical protein [Streptomyces sp. NPDC059533]
MGRCGTPRLRRLLSTTHPDRPARRLGELLAGGAEDDAFREAEDVPRS